MSLRALGITMRTPLSTSPPTTANSVKTGSNYGPRVLLSRVVKYLLAIAFSVNSGSFRSLSHDTTLGSEACTTALISFSNTSVSQILHLAPGVYTFALHRRLLWMPGVVVCLIGLCPCLVARYIVDWIVEILQTDSHSILSVQSLP